MECDHLNKLSITFQQQDQCEIWWQMAMWFLKNHDFIHVNSSVAGKYNKHKQDGSHLGFPIRMILATVDLQVTSIPPINFESIVLSVQEKKFKTDFQDGHMAAIWDFLSQRFELFFYLQVTLMLPTKFRVNWPFSSEEEGKDRFSRWPPSWISDWNDFSYFYIYKSSPCCLPIFKSIGPLVQENKQKKGFQDAAMVAILDFRSKKFKLF